MLIVKSPKWGTEPQKTILFYNYYYTPFYSLPIFYIHLLFVIRCSPELAHFLLRCVVRRLDERATVKELLQSAFLQRAAADGVIPFSSYVTDEEAAIVVAAGGDSIRATTEETELPKLTALVQGLQDDELTVAVLKIVSSIVAEATYETLVTHIFQYLWWYFFFYCFVM